MDIVGSLAPSHVLSDIQFFGQNNEIPRSHPITRYLNGDMFTSPNSHMNSKVWYTIGHDRGTQFTSALWSSICHQLGVQLHRTTAYHPQANGLADRFHRTVKVYLMARLTGPNWFDETMGIVRYSYVS